jgi:hypothetical protein
MHGAVGLRGGLLVVALATFAAPAWGFDAGSLDGDWTVTGKSHKSGSYTGSVQIQQDASGEIHFESAFTYANGKFSSFTATGRPSGNKIKLKGILSTGFIGALGGAGTAELTGTWKVKNAGRIDGSWTTSTGDKGSERLTRSAPTAGTILTLVDGDGKDVTGKDKLKKGVVLACNIDDDDDAWKDADGKVDCVADKDRTDVQNEDDLLPIKLAKPAGMKAGAEWKLTYPTDTLAVWSTKTKNSGTKIDSGKALPADDTTLWVEGIAASKPGDGETLTVELESNGQTIATDAGRFRVASSAFLLIGHGNSGSYYLDRWLSSHKLDKRKDPVLVMGKDEKGKPAAWAVYIWKDEKHAKMALSTEGAVVAYDGHSNFGLGYAFETHFTNVRQFMNIAEPQVPVNWVYLREHQDHPDLMFDDSDYGDDASTPEFSDPVQVDAKYDGAHGHYKTSHYLASGSNGPNPVRCHLTRGSVKWKDNHFGSPDDLRIVVKAGSRDMPAKRWSKLFLNSCYSGDYYHDSFGGRGVLFFTKDESSSSETSALFIEGFIEGKSNEGVLKDLNHAQNINDYHDFGP